MRPRTRTPATSPPAPNFGGEQTETSVSSQSDATADRRELDQRRCPDVDPETGQLRRISDEEWQARQEKLTKRLAEIDSEDDTPDEVYDEFMRNLDEERRCQGRPPAFEGHY
jgi:hypothetical protein